MLIVFTDLDGTLLDHFSYSWAAAIPALRKLQSKKIPLIMASSKTQQEMQFYASELGVENDPFIVENGSALYYPSGYFGPEESGLQKTGIQCTVFGRPFDEIVEFLNGLEATYNCTISGFHNASVKEIRKETGLDEMAINRAKHRQFSVPVFYRGNVQELLVEAVKESPFQLVYGGRFIHVLGKVDKGRALKFVMKKMTDKYPDRKLTSVALGDSLNDFPMLSSADVAVLIRRHNGRFETRAKLHDAIYTEGIGPAGWNEAVLQLLDLGEYGEQNE